MNKLYKENRKKFAKEMDNDSLFISFAGKIRQKSGDQFYKFTPRRNFYYMTGIDRQNIILTIHKNKAGEVTETLYIERFDELEAKWSGAVLSKDEAVNISGIDKTRLVEDFKKDVTRFFFGAEKLKVYMDLENRYFNPDASFEISFAKEIKDSYPHIEIANAYGIFTKLRVIKSKEEVKEIEKAINITKDGIYLMMKNSKPGMYEYEYEAHFDYHLKKSGVKEHAFNTIAATGKNATVLHYTDNNTKTADGELILFDLGAAHNYYCSDISRTFPANGKFTERQKELYNIVLEANLKVISKIKPGLEFKELNEIVIAHYEEELKRIGLIKDKSEISKYYYHGVSHYLGLETHDVGRGNETTLKKGMVLTVEPGLYIEEEKIGIRIEDDVLVTDDGCQVLSKDIIKTVEEIEDYMAKPASKTKKTK